MRFGIYLIFDPQAEQVIQSLREKLVADIPGLPKVAGKMRPHLTLLVFDEADPACVQARFEETINAGSSFPILLTDIDIFPGRQNVLFIKPAQPDPLKAMHRYCFSAFSDVEMASHYRDPACWHPHITLSKGIDDEALRKAEMLAKQLWLPITAHIRGIGLINVQKPLEVLASKLLA